MTEPDELKPADLEAYMQLHGIPGEILHLGVPTPTVEAAAEAVGTDPERIVKSILFLVAGQPVLTITCGPAYVERRTLAALYNVGRKKVKLASPETVSQETGYPVRGMPPFGHRSPLHTLIDYRVLEKPDVYAGGGADRTLIRMSPLTIMQAAQAQVLDLLIPPGLGSDADID